MMNGFKWIGFFVLLLTAGCSATTANRPAPEPPGPARAGREMAAPGGPKSPGKAQVIDRSAESAPAPSASAAPAGPDRPAMNAAEDEELAVDDEEDSEASPRSREDYFSHALALCRISKHYWERGELERAVETLDEAYSLILEVDPENDPKLLQEKEDLRIAISRRILEIYSSRRVVMNGRRNEIPLTLNAHVQEEIDGFTNGREKDFFIQAYRRSGKYRPRIEAALKEAGLPAELAWLPLIESGFKLTALSPARALGLWQFIPSTGYRYGLNRDAYIDERLDPEKSTRAAIDYLKDLHGMFGDWTTVLAAYNCGEHRVLKTIESQNINYLDHFWDLYERLPRETARYVPRFLATLHIVSAPGKYGLEEPPVGAPLPVETVHVPKQTSLKAIAQASGVDEDRLRELNIELRQGILPAGGYELKVPEGEGPAVLARVEELPAVSPRRPERTRGTVAVTRHKVKRGETLSAIARKYGTDTASILRANNMRKASALPAGKILRISTVACEPENPPAQAAAKPAPRTETAEHTVRHGDSLWNIARRYGTTAEEIQRLNKVTPTSLSVGQVLQIRVPAAEAKAEARSARAPSKPKTHTVRPGETPAAIARQHGMSAERLLAINRLNARSTIHPGQTLILE
jgi:membrane-bound lytic murein transglycosylase D